MKTLMAKKETVTREWLLVDAADMPIGRVASQVAAILRGKHKTIFTPHVDTGDYVIVINTDKMILTGKKDIQKKYYRHSGYPGGLKTRNAKRMLELQPQKVLEASIRGMLPKGKLGDQMYGKLYVYVGPEHPHQAQKPEVYTLRG